jgi:hypothetical protein
MSPDTLFTNINAEPLLLANNEDPANEEFVLSKLYRRVLNNNTRNNTIITAKRTDPEVFIIGQIVLLAIPAKNRLTREATRLPYRVIKVAKGAYTLLSQFS